MPLFTDQDLSTYLGYTVDATSATMAERVAWGWLKAATGLTVQPATVPEELFSWAIELGAIAHENPGGLSTETDGDITSQWAQGRRSEILAAARSSTSGPATATGAPQGYFPAPASWPDPAERPPRTAYQS